MIGFQAPYWLLLMGLIPLIRWLHRFRLDSSILPSTTLFLWRRLQRFSSRDGSPGKPDPRWILRASIGALMILALARPYSQGPREYPVDVWIDDSLSMFTREHQQSRMQAGLQLLQSYLREHEFSRIRVHSLGEPAAVLALDPEDDSGRAAQLDAWFSHPRAEPSPPPMDRLSKQGNHILVTDGADSALNRWAQTAPLTHIIQTGALRQNLALGRLSLRNSLTDSGPVTGTARVDNLGDVAGSVRLVIQHRGNIVKTEEFEVPAMESRLTGFSIAPGKTGTVAARLENAEDPLPLDNSIEIDLAQLQSSIGYSTIGDCAAAIMAVVDSHPALARTDARPELLIDCSGENRNSLLPTLMLHRPAAVRRTTQTAHWHKELQTGYLPIAAGAAYSAEAPALSSANFPVLSANGRMLILTKPGAGHVIHCYLDTADIAFSREAQFPLLILGLIGELTQRSMETVPISIDRDARASRIRALPLNFSAASPPEFLPVRSSFFTSEILFIAIFLLVVDALLGLLLVSGKISWRT